ncbi:VOC family protein [Alkalihalobacillus sp. TS-13]|uniref:VOC family protein n=1 Tax=Alkalihalobacillus sp. TS-13 TaxID=2842455 RepID=UPI001C882702|nr:VOC family protein [Alkalihalobacillus sp. TS-13]
MSQSLLSEIHYFRIPVNNLSESVTWYTERLGFTLRHNSGELAVMALESGPLFVLVEADQGSRGHFTIGGQLEFSVGFTTTDINALHSKFSAQGIQTDEIQEDNGHQYFHFFDPSGNKLQVHN